MQSPANSSATSRSGRCARITRCGLIRGSANDALLSLWAEFDALYTLGRKRSRRSVCCGRFCYRPYYSIRSERQLVENIEFDLLFVGGSSVWMPTTRSGCDRLLAGEMAPKFPGRRSGASEGQAIAARALFGRRNSCDPDVTQVTFSWPTQTVMSVIVRVEWQHRL